ncbi:HdeD family acid-resistance protein [Gymnodinialimonas sp. 57CJ19]|uniref:HdeD family acid-resistance protein n=1 Tax=Gymnodinialimonas sp. 57CJ19 TaxID=3138498 RepID=UPI0031345640
MDTTLNFFARNWWLVLLRGIAAIVFGLMAFVWPVLTLSVLVILFGAYILADGVFSTIDAIRLRNEVDKWWLGLLDGLLGIVAGGLMLFMPGITALVMLVFLAAWSILGGALRILLAVQLRKEIEGEWLLVVSGLLSIAFGVAIVALPHAGLVSIAWIIGFWAIAFGVLFILLSLRLRRAV